MAVGGHNTSDDSLDLSELNAEIEKLGKSSESDIEDSLAWENSQADLAFDSIAKEEDKKEFLGFPLTSTPTKSKSKSDKKHQSAPSSPVSPSRKSWKSPEGAKSAPVSPVLARPTLSVLERIQSWESTINTETQVHSVSGARPKAETSLKGEICTHRTVKNDLLVY